MPNFVQSTKITGNDPLNQIYYFGGSTALNDAGNMLAVGTTSTTSTIYIFTGNKNNWNQLTGITTGINGFGYSIGLNGAGNVLVAGEPYYQNELLNFAAGAAYIYTGSGINWKLVANITGTDINAQTYANLGYSVSINNNGNVVAIGAPCPVFAPNGSAGNGGPGSVYIFTRSGNNWNQAIRLNGENSLDQFGFSTALNSAGNILAVGANNFSNGKGAVYVFTGSGSNWQISNKFFNQNASTTNLGTSVSLNSSGDILAAGNYAYYGSVYIFTGFLGTDTNWNAPVIVEGVQFFGYKTALNKSGDLLAVSAFDPIYNAVSYVDIYTKSGFNWIKLNTFNGGPTGLGRSISFNKNSSILALGAYNPSYNRTGSVFIYQSQPTIFSSPSGISILSGQSLNNSILTGGNADIPGNFYWIDPSIIPQSIGRYSYPVTFIPYDSGNYLSSNTQANVNVLGTPNIITKPTGASIKYDQTLENSNLSFGQADVPGIFNWTNPQIKVNNTGTLNYLVTFVPTSEYYTTIFTDANINVEKADQNINFPYILDKVIGYSFKLTATSDSNLPITYTNNTPDLISLENINGNFIVTSKMVGNATITADQNGNNFYQPAASVLRTFNINELPFVSKNDFDLNLNYNNLTNNLNFDVEINGSPLISKSFDVNNNQPFYIGLEKDHVYGINVKSKEKLFAFENLTGIRIISSNSYTNVSNLNIDFSQNEPQLNISTEVKDSLSLIYKLDDIITPSGIESVNKKGLKAFTIDYQTYITGELLYPEQIPSLNYKKYELINYCPPKQVTVVQQPSLTEDPCTVDFTCIICSEALKIRSNNPSQTFIDIPQEKMPYRIYKNLIDYIFTNTNPGFYRIVLNDKLFSLCCECKKVGIMCTKELEDNVSGAAAPTKCNDNLFERPKSINENSINQKYGLYFLDAITLKSINTNYGPYSYYSGEIKNSNNFNEGDKIIFNQYPYNFEEVYADIYMNNPAHRPVNAEFIYSTINTGDKYFYNSSQLVDKINEKYNSSGIYTWLPILYSKTPYYNYGPMLLAELKDESTISLISLKSGRLGEHEILLSYAPKPSAKINSYLVPKIIELQGSNDGLNWNKIVSSADVQPVNILSTSYSQIGGDVHYEAIDNTTVTRKITVPTSSTIGNRIVPSGAKTNSGDLLNLIDKIQSGNKKFKTGDGAEITCIPSSSGRFSAICGSGYIELWSPSGCAGPDEPQESGIKENEERDASEENSKEKTLLVEESTFRLGFTDYR